MSARRLALLAAATLAVAALALFAQWTGRGAAPERGARLLPELDGQLERIEAVRITAGGDRPLVTLQRGERGWTVAERDGYAADTARLRRLLVALAALEVVEAKTSDPALYPRLGVEDVAAPAAQGVRIEVDGLDRPLALVVGKDSGAGSTWVRREREAGSLEVRPALAVDRDVALWLDRRLVAVAADRIRRIDYAPTGAQSWALERDAADAEFRILGLPTGRQAYDPAAAAPLASAYEAVDAQDVRRARAEDFAASPARVTLSTFDGLQLTLELEADASEARARLVASVAAGREVAASVRAEAEALAARSRGWTYQLPAYRVDTLVRRLDTLLAPP